MLIRSVTNLPEEGESNEHASPLSDAEQRAILKVIKADADRLVRFVESIAGLARTESGDMLLHRNWGTVEEIIESWSLRSEF